MVFTIICALIVIAVVALIITNRVKGKDWWYTLGDAAGAGAAWLVIGGMLLLAATAVGSLFRDDEGWETRSEAVYTVAEGSDIVADGSSIEFVKSKDGDLENVVLYISDDVVYAEDSEAPRTVTVREEFRELGTGIFPWGQGDTKTTAIIK